jgi:FKBP-type peptidyl-prolyl cis-trans isomerase
MSKRNHNSIIMKISIITLLLLAVGALAEDKPPQLNTTTDKFSYSIGLSIGQNVKRQGVDMNADAFVAGLKDGLGGKKPALSEDQIKQVTSTMETQMREKMAEASQKNASEGQKFLEENKKKPGVKTTASGLQYKVEKEGNGAQPKPEDTVTVNYRGTLTDGTEFDSSYKRGQPATFPVVGVIKGWTEALQLMKAGAKYQLFIPPDLAYGAQMRASIPANSTLIFEVELLEVKPNGAAPTPVPTVKLMSPTPKPSKP